MVYGFKSKWVGSLLGLTYCVGLNLSSNLATIQFSYVSTVARRITGLFFRVTIYCYRYNWVHKSKSVLVDFARMAWVTISFTLSLFFRAYDRALIHFRGIEEELNFPLGEYSGEVDQVLIIYISPCIYSKFLKEFRIVYFWIIRSSYLSYISHCISTLTRGNFDFLIIID